MESALPPQDVALQTFRECFEHWIVQRCGVCSKAGARWGLEKGKDNALEMLKVLGNFAYEACSAAGLRLFHPSSTAPRSDVAHLRQ